MFCTHNHFVAIPVMLFILGSCYCFLLQKMTKYVLQIYKVIQFLTRDYISGNIKRKHGNKILQSWLFVFSYILATTGVYIIHDDTNIDYGKNNNLPI